VNAVLRRFLRERDRLLRTANASEEAQWNYPQWWIDKLRKDWPNQWEDILQSGNARPPLTLRVNRRLGGVEDYLQLLTQQQLEATQLGPWAVRLTQPTPVSDIPGFLQGRVSVQDAAAQLAAPLMQLEPGMRVLDACAAPGGKTAQLASTGAEVTALDRSAPRLAVLKANLDRLGLAATTITADATAFEHEPFDAVLLDAPCTATGTIRRHPDVAWTKMPTDEAKLIALQARLLDRAVDLTRPGGRLIYCTCSLQPGEGEDQVTRILALRPDLALDAIADHEVGVPGSTTPRGEFRALPHQLHGESPRLSGWGGFFAARFVRQAS
jgi:16S rRNA (cytosine967-C5)-methyltransferase